MALTRLQFLAVIIKITVIEAFSASNDDSSLSSSSSSLSQSPCSVEPTKTHATIVKCRHAPLDMVSKAVGLLVVSDTLSGLAPLAVNVSSVDISECDINTLPNLFARLNETLEYIRVAQSLLHFVAANAFKGLENKLRILDLSGNKLTAIPLVINSLTTLEMLDLSDNRIRSVQIEFTSASSLRRLDLSFNLVGFAEGGPNGLDPLNPAKNIPRQRIEIEHFDVASISTTLEFLDLSHNGLNLLPDQLLNQPDGFLARLKILKLGGNRLRDVPEKLVDTLWDLQKLYLDSNLLRSLKFSSLPSHVKVLTLEDNPLQCDCNIMWLLDTLRRNSSLTLRLPPCSTPFYIRDLTLSNLNDQRLCPPDQEDDKIGVKPHVVYVTDRDLASFHLGLFQALHLLDVVGEVDALFISWKVDPEFYTLSGGQWAVILRHIDSNIYDFNSTRFTLANYEKDQPVKEGGIYSDSIRGLEAPKFHLVCIASVEGKVHYVHLNNCKGAVTLQESQITHNLQTTAKQDLTVAPASSSTSPSPTTTTTSGQLKTRVNFTVSGQGDVDNVRLTWTVFENASPWPREIKSPLNFRSMFTRPIYSWSIRVRKFGSTTVDRKTIEDTAKVDNSDTNHTSGAKVDDLTPQTPYIICVRLISTPSGEEGQESCVEVTTKPKHDSFTRAQVATAAVASAASAAVCTALVAFCLKSKCKQKIEDDTDVTTTPVLPLSDILQRIQDPTPRSQNS